MFARKRSISISGHRTSFSLEDTFFDDLVFIANQRQQSIAQLVTEIDNERPRDSNLSSSLRLYVLQAAKNGELKPNSQNSDH